LSLDLPLIICNYKKVELFSNSSYNKEAITTLYEWDEAKRKSNIARHGVDFTVMEALGWDTAIINPDDRTSEPRWVAYGFIGVRLYVVVFTERGDNIRLISLCKANQREETRYGQKHERQ